MNNNPLFDYDFFKKILFVLKKNFSFCSFQNAAKIINHYNSKPYVLLRHDVDLDLDHAVKMALIEKELNVRSCYMIMTNSPFYSLDDDRSKSNIRKMIAMGHEIGLHFDFSDNSYRNNEVEIKQVKNYIEMCCVMLENITDSKINSISFHRPLQQFLRGPFHIEGRINAYSAELMKWYLSDSKGNWREGNPLSSIENLKDKILQLLIHPIWWDEKHLEAPDRLQTFFEHRTKNFSAEEKNKFDITLSSYLTIQRSQKGM